MYSISCPRWWRAGNAGPEGNGVWARVVEYLSRKGVDPELDVRGRLAVTLY